jgi:hypothetical protein
MKLNNSSFQEEDALFESLSIKTEFIKWKSISHNFIERNQSYRD